MGNFRIEDMQFDEAEVGSLTNREGTKIITLDFAPYEEGVTIMHYTPDQARKLAAALILAADEAEKR